jgi:hypothetical protein
VASRFPVRAARNARACKLGRIAPVATAHKAVGYVQHTNVKIRKPIQARSTACGLERLGTGAFEFLRSSPQVDRNPARFDSGIMTLSVQDLKVSCESASMEGFGQSTNERLKRTQTHTIPRGLPQCPGAACSCERPAVQTIRASAASTFAWAGKQRKRMLHCHANEANGLPPNL